MKKIKFLEIEHYEFSDFYKGITYSYLTGDWFIADNKSDFEIFPNAVKKAIY